MLIDRVQVIFSGGSGGDGIVSFGKMAHSGPDGGNGGKGGDVYILAETDITLLNQFTRQKIFTADRGENGGKNKKAGKSGSDMVVKLPVGTAVTDKISGKTLFELNRSGQKELICAGGAGGKGNYEFRSPRRTTPMFAKSGFPGEKKEIVLNLKLIADFGLIGKPNAGKSSLLNELTMAKAKIANYPFTTLVPNLGVMNGKIIADIPGLIEGAHLGRGLGISFLKHIEKVKLLLHCLSSDSADPVADYKIVRSELENYNKKMVNKSEVILLTKSDLVETKQIKLITKKLQKYSKEVHAVSIHDWDSIERLKELLRKI